MATRTWSGIFRLQCGHGHEAVENLYKLFPRVLVCRSLQCGHGHEAVENEAVPVKKTRRLPCFNAATAMRPWRTSDRLRKEIEHSVRLQCGHGHEAVENQSRSRTSSTGGICASMRPRP